MSNIQITENASGKYSPEWFYSESQTPEWISFAHKADELRENFINLFGIERLKSLSGKDLLTSLFYNDEGTKTNLCYILEMDKDIREVFGSISGGAAYKFGLFYHKKNQSWTCGSPLKPVLLTEAEAIQKADEMRNDLVEGAEIISSFGPLDSEEDYEQLYKQLEHIPGINMVWRMKYYQMLFPALFAPFYGQDIQLRVLHFLNQKPSDIPFIRMGQISLYARKCNVPGVVFAHIYGKNVGYTNETNDSDTNTLSDKKHKTHYWMYTVFDDKSWNECQQKGIMVLGMDDIGDYSQFASKEALRQELIDVYDSSTSRKNQALMAWNFANTVSVNDVIFAKRSNTLVGKGIVTGNYVFDDLRQEYKNVRAVKWLQVGEWEHPGNAVAKRLTDITPYTDYMMNTADRSLAMLDYALRRRFSFFTMKPGFNTPGFQAYQDSLKSDAFNKLIACVKQLNSKIAEDISLGEGFCIGHSYFCGLTPETANAQTLSSIIEYELIPLLKEYWFDEPAKVIDWSDRLRSAVK